MAYTYRNSTSAGGASGSTITVTKPTATADGDLIVVALYLESDTNTWSTVPTGWNLFHSYANTGAFKLWIYWKWASSEGASWDWIPNTTAWRSALCASYSGASGTGTPEDVKSENQGDAVAEASQTAPSVTTTATNDLLVFHYGDYAGSTPTTVTGAASNRRVGANGQVLSDANIASATSTGTTRRSDSAGNRDFVSIHTAFFSSAGAASLEQEGYRWRNDNGSETTATWKENQDTVTSGAKEVNVRLRMLINASGDTAATAYQLEHKKGAGGTYEKTKTATAFPVVATSNTTAATTPGTGLTVNMPASIAAGDLLIITAANDNTGGTNMGISGWTQLAHTQYTGNVVSHGIWAKIAAGSDTATITGAANDIAVISMRITGHGVSDVSTDIKIGTPATSVDTGDAAPDPPNLDAGSSKKWLWIETFGAEDDDDTATYWTTTTYTFTGIAQQQSASSTSSCLVAAAYYNLEAQTLNPAAMAMAASEEWIANTLAIPPATDYVLISASDNITAGGEATTAQLTAPAGKTTGNFTTGRMWDNENGTDTIDIASDYYTELEWCIKVQAAAAAADVYYFRVTAAGAALNTYTLTPTYTISSVKYFTPAIASTSSTGDGLLPVARSVSASRASTSSTGDAVLTSTVSMSASVASTSSTGDALLPVARAVTSAVASTSSTGDALIPVARSVTAAAASTSSTGDALIPVARPVTGAIASTSSTGDALLPVARPVTGAVASTSSTGDALIPVARPVTAAAASTSSTGDAALDPGAGTTWQFTAAVTSLSTTGDALIPVARPVVSAIASTSSTGDALIPVARAVTAASASLSTTGDSIIGVRFPTVAAVASTSTTGDALLPVARAITTALASLSSTGDALLPVARPVTAAVASTSTTGDANLNATTVYNLIAAVASLSTTGDALIPVARAVTAAMGSTSATGDAIVGVRLPTVAAAASLSTTGDALLPVARSVTVTCASLSTTGDALIPVARPVTGAMASQSATGDALLPVLRPVIASGASLSSTGDASLTTATVYSLIAAVASQSSTGDVLLPVARALAANVASQSVTPDATASVLRALVSAVASLSSTSDANLQQALIQGLMVLTWTALSPSMTFSGAAAYLSAAVTGKKPSVTFAGAITTMTFGAKQPTVTFTEA